MSQGEEEGSGGTGWGDAGGAGWLSGWIQSAKEKSVSALNVVTRDLAEFTNTMHDDGVKVATTVKEKLTQENATAATAKVKQGVSSVLAGISKALVVEPDDDYQLAKIVGGQAVVFDRFKAKLHTVQVDPNTYTTDPVPEDAYRDWLPTFDLDSKKGNISELLVSNVEVRALYTQLVPMTVSNADFWSRYFYRIHQLEQDEARRVELMKRADLGDGTKELGWDEDDDEDWTDVRNIPVENTVGGTGTETASTAPVPTAAEVRLSEVSTVESERSDPTAAQTDTTVSSPPDTSSTLDSNSSSTAVDPQLVPCSASTEESVVEPADAAPVVADAAPCSVSQPSDPGSSAGTAAASETAKSDSPVVVGATPERTSPSDASSNAKESLDDDWEKDFDVEVTEQEIEAAKERIKSPAMLNPAINPEEKGEDWEDW